MYWNVFGLTVSGDFLDWVHSTVRVVGVGYIYANGILVDLRFHLAEMHSILTVMSNLSLLESKIVAGLIHCCMCCFTVDHIGVANVLLLEFVFSVGQN